MIVFFKKLRQVLFLAVVVAGFGVMAHAQAINLRLMPVGDSITAGYEGGGAVPSYNGYRGPLAAALQGQVATFDFVGSQIDGTILDPDNKGHIGYFISQIANLITPQLQNYKPNLILLDIGANDCNQSSTQSGAADRLSSLVNQIMSAEPDATLLLGQLITDGTASSESCVQNVNSQLPSIVSALTTQGKHIMLVDMSALTYPSDYSDTLHPNDTGYQLMANAWDKAIQQVIANKWISDPLAGSITRPTGAIYSGISGKCLDYAAVSGSNAINAVLNDCSSSTSQQWNLNSGQIAINGKCLDIYGGGTANETGVDLFSCNGQSNQQWTVSNGHLVNPASGLCLDDPGGSTANGTQLEIFTCNTGLNQQWRVPSEGPVVSGLSGNLCLDSFGGSTAIRNKVDAYGCNQTAAQQWKVTNNTLTFDGQCLDINNGVPSGTSPQVEIYTCNGGTNQVWVPMNGTLVNPISGRCLDVPANTSPGTQLDLEGCNGTVNQNWTTP